MPGPASKATSTTAKDNANGFSINQRRVHPSAASVGRFLVMEDQVPGFAYQGAPVPAFPLDTSTPARHDLVVPETSLSRKADGSEAGGASRVRVDPSLAAQPLATALFTVREDGTVVPERRVKGGAEQSEGSFLPHLEYADQGRGIWLYRGNCLEFLDVIAQQYPEGRFDVIFADPPYFLSNGGITCHAGRMVKVDKGQWDKSRGPELNHEFNFEWLRRCQRALKPNGSIWVTGTQHVIFSVGYAMQQLGFKILNDIAWEKPNPPPNLSCRYFTHSTETVIWAAKSAKTKHTFNYKAMRQLNGGKQMKTVWKIGAPLAGEKTFGKHPTQKPVALVERCLLASTKPGDLVLDPFVGAGTTAVAAARLGRRCVAIDLDLHSVQVAARRVQHAVELFPGPQADAGV